MTAANVDSAFLSDIHDSIARALHQPEAFLRIRKYPEVRRILAKRFPYRFFLLYDPTRGSCLRCYTPLETNDLETACTQAVIISLLQP